MLKCAGDVGVGAMTQSGRMIASFAVLAIAFATITARAQPGEVHGRQTLLHRSRRKFTLLRRLCRRRGLLHNGSACRSAERAVLPNDARRAAFGELQTGMSTAVALLKINCPTYRAPRPVVRLEVMEQYLTTLRETASRACEVERRAERALQQTYPRSGLTPRHANASWC
jgi:hypothetical protein